MVRILISGISLLTLVMHTSCRNNHTDREDRLRSEAPASEKSTIPIPVSAMELCAHFNSNAGSAVTKYKDHILALSGNVAQSAPEPVDNNCRNIIINCAATDKRDTGTLSIVIRHCRRDEITSDTINPGKVINIHCRFIAWQDGVIKMEEVAAPE
ncbi:MAG: hypothetical protein JNM21_14145 [Taibaiella sp.]|nr:hypothetical protein [Taibaiella sp.]